MGQKTKALLIGIDDYLPAGKGIGDLNGCGNDVGDVRSTLITCGFQPTSIRVLKNADATKAGILAQLSWLLTNNQPGDSIVLHYSGHGSRRLDTNGNESDGRDEVICTYDRPSVISDDELAQLFARLQPGVNLEVFKDCCHAGDSTRNNPLDNANGNTAIRFLPPEPSASRRFETSLKRAVRTIVPVPVPVPKLNHTLWAACKDNQEARETSFGNEIRGIFTYYLCVFLRQTSGKITRSKLDALITSAVSRKDPKQIPLLETSPARIEKEIFT